jgi:hypothetical protein
MSGSLHVSNETDTSKLTLLPPGFLDQETCVLRPLAPPLFLPDGREFKTWERPVTFSRTYHVAQRGSGASDNNPGTEERPWRTIGKAARTLRPGERVVVHEGVYRELVSPARGGAGPEAMISYEGAEGEEVILRGSELFDGDFIPEENHYRIAVPETIVSLGDENPFALVNYTQVRWEGEAEELSDEELNARERRRRMKEERHPNILLRQGLVFQDGRRMRQVAGADSLSKSDGAYFVEGDGKSLRLRLFGDADPRSARIELTARPQVFAPGREGLGFIRVKNFLVEFTAGRIPFPQRGAVSSGRGHHWIIEDNIIRDVNSLGMDVGHRQIPRLPREFEMKPAGIGQIVRRNRLERCGVCGIAGIGVFQGMIEDNVCVDTGFLDVRDICESAAIKIHYSCHTVVRRNLVLRTIDAPGIWIDHSNHNVRCTGNVIYGVRVEDLDGWGGGVFFEASLYHNLVDHNIIWNCHADGIYQHDCERLVVAHNLIGHVAARPFRMIYCPTRIIHDRPGTGLHNRVLGNIFYAFGRLPELARPENQSDWNIFVSPPGGDESGLREWREKSGQDKQSLRAVATLELSPQTWVLKWTPIAPSINVRRIKAVTRDFLGTPTDNAEIPAGPFADSNITSSVSLRNPAWRL